MRHPVAAAAITGLAIAVLILAILAACTPDGACAATPKPTLRKPAPANATPAKPRPTVTVTKNGTYHIDVDHDDDHC